MCDLNIILLDDILTLLVKFIYFVMIMSGYSYI